MHFSNDEIKEVWSGFCSVLTECDLYLQGAKPIAQTHSHAVVVVL